MNARREPAMVPEAEFASYYGRPILKRPVWKTLAIGGYLFLGGLAGASSVVAWAADLTGRPDLARVSKLGAAGSITLGAAALVHDLGRPERFLNMLRVAKPTSPMSMGSWLLAGYAPAAAVAATSVASGRLPRLGAAATAGAACLGPLVASYTAALISDTAIPAWHESYRQMPFVFVGSAASAAGGWALLAGPAHDLGPARLVAVGGAAVEVVASRLMHDSIRGTLMQAAEALTVAAATIAAVTSRRRTIMGRSAGAALLAASALTRWAILEAGHAIREPTRARP